MSDIAIYEGGQLDGYRPQIMTPDAARELDEQLRACTRAVLRDGTDYGVIPGTSGEKVLYRPGAQKLLQWFGLTFTCDRTDIETDADGRKHGITYRAVVSKRGTGEVLATCEGTADYDESKFYKAAEQVQREAEARERSWAKKDRRVANPEKWKNLPEYRAPWNTLVKRAQKRAIVGATIDATAAGGIFADDEDSDPFAPADGGPSWYQRALAEAASLTTKEDGRRLFAEAAHANLNGEATRDQATHVQNRIRQRIEQLETHIQVDFTEDAPVVTDRRRSQTAPPAGGTTDSSPAQAANPSDSATATPPAGAGEDPTVSPQASSPAGRAPSPEKTPPPSANSPHGSAATRGQIGLIQKEFERLDMGGDDQRDGRLRVVSRLAGRPLESSKDLTGDEARKVKDTLQGLTGAADLEALLAELSMADDPRDEDGTTADA